VNTITLLVGDNGTGKTDYLTRKCTGYYIDYNHYTDSLLDYCHESVIRIAFPAIGCGLGGLKWADVKPIIQQSGIEKLVKVVYCEEGD